MTATPTPARAAGTTDERVEDVRARLAASPALAEAVRAAVVDGRVPAAARRVIPPRAPDVLTADTEPLESVVPVDALEAIVQRVGRPPLLIRDGAVELQELVDFPPGTDRLVKGVEPVIPSVGRVEFVNHRMAWGGTGWVVDGEGDQRIVATNRHVAAVVAQRVRSGRGVFLRSPAGALYGADVDFCEEVGAHHDDARVFTVRDIVHLAEDSAPDVALLRITGHGLPDPLQLAAAEAERDALVATIGYPAFDTRNDRGDQARYFLDIYDVKRLAPGFVRQPLSGRTVLTHDCTTLGGNSGSPLVDLRTGSVVGLHFSGIYGVANSAVGVGSLRRALAGTQRPVIPVPRGPREDGREAADGARAAEDLRDRDGYHPGFLGDGLRAPWPGLPEEVRADLARPVDGTGEDPFQLRYTHFGVLFSTVRRQPLVTAVTVDGAHLVRIKRGRDRWFTDARIDPAHQLRREDFDDPRIDRGHLVRRQDPVWDPDARPGAASELAARANDDTFHYTNAAVQHSAMNQGAQLWRGLEDHVLDSARTHGFRACVFTGPVNRDDDPEIGPGVLAPREFWKLVATRDAEGAGLHATAYLLSQGDLIRDLLERRGRTEAVEGFELGPYRSFQIAVRDLADATGYDFSAYLDADPLARAAEADEAVGGAPLFRRLDRLDDVVLQPSVDGP